MKRNLYACLAVVLCLVAAALSQAAYPATPAGGAVEAWIKNYNQFSQEATRTFASETYAASLLAKVSAERFAAMDGDFQDRWGKIVVHKVDAKGEQEASATIRNQDGNIWVRFTVKVEAEPPHKIADLNFERISRPADVAGPARLGETDLIAAVGKYLDQRAAADKFSGVALIARAGKPVFVKAYGMADHDAKIPNKPDTKFALGSMNKMLTSVAIAQLAQAGKLKYTDTIAQLLPDYPNKDVAGKVTVHQLLTHTSGLGDVFGPEFQEKKDSIHTVREWFPLFVDKPLRFEPGKGWSYSNAGFVVLGAIIEKVSGQDYYAYIREHIYKPAGMADSDSYAKTDKVANMAEGYTSAGAPGGSRRNNVDTRPFRGFPAGGGYSTVYDLLKFSEALRQHKLLNVEYTGLIITGKVDPRPGVPRRYAYGFEDNRSDGFRTVGHGGGAPGMNGMLEIYWETPYTVAVLSNFDPPAAGDVAEFIRDHIQIPASAGRAENDDPKAGQKTTSRGPVN